MIHDNNLARRIRGSRADTPIAAVPSSRVDAKRLKPRRDDARSERSAGERDGGGERQVRGSGGGCSQCGAHANVRGCWASEQAGGHNLATLAILNRRMWFGWLAPARSRPLWMQYVLVVLEWYRHRLIAELAEWLHRHCIALACHSSFPLPSHLYGF